MKSFFACALVAAIAYGQDETSASAEEVPVTPWYDYVFEMNESGNWQVVQPHMPTLEFTDVDDAEIQAWMDQTMAEDEALQQEWVDAWNAYMGAVQQPWNDFLDKAEDMTIRGHENDLNNQMDVISFVVDNTFVDGTSLRDAFPDVEEVFVHNAEEIEWMKANFNLDHFRFNKNMKRRQEGEEMPEEPCPLEQMAAELEGKAIEYGYDPEVVQAWLEDNEASWEELQQRQDLENAQKAQRDIAEAADYVKGILDNMMADLQAARDAEVARYEADTQHFIDELKAHVDAEAEKEMQAVEDWINNTYAEVTNFDAWEMPQPMMMQEYVEEEEPSMLEEIVSELQGKLQEWGYDPEAASQWMETKNAEWEEMGARQDAEAMEMAEENVQEGADYIKGIFDNMVEDMRAQHEAEQAQFEAELDAFAAQLRDEVDANSQADVDAIGNFINDAYEHITEATTADLTQEDMAFAIQGKTQNSNTGAYMGAAAISAGAIATALYLYKKRQQQQAKPIIQEEDKSFDEQFIQV